MCNVGSLDVDEVRGSSRMGLGKNSGQQQNHFNHYSLVLGEMFFLLGLFNGDFGALMGPHGSISAPWPL